MAMTVAITHPEDSGRELHPGESYRNSGALDAADIARAQNAALHVLTGAGVTPEAAEAAYRAQWIEFDDEAPMTGPARVWIDAREAANRALTAPWSRRVNLGVGLATRAP